MVLREMDYAVVEVSLQQTYKPVTPPMTAAGKLPIIEWIRVMLNVNPSIIRIVSFETSL